MGRYKSNINTTIWENTFPNSLKSINELDKILNLKLVVDTFQHLENSTVYTEWIDTYKDCNDMLMSLQKRGENFKLKKFENLSSPIKHDYHYYIYLPIINLLESLNSSSIKHDYHYSIYLPIINILESLNSRDEIIKFTFNKEVLNCLEDIVGFRINKSNILENFHESIIGNPLPKTFKDISNKNISDKTILSCLSLILTFASVKDISITILNKELSEKLKTVLKERYPNDLPQEEKERNTYNFKIIYNFLKENISDYIPLSNGIKYYTIFYSCIKHNKVYKLLKQYVDVLKNIKIFFDKYNHREYNDLLDKINKLFFDQNNKQNSLDSLYKQWSSTLENLISYKEQLIEEYIPKIAEEDMQSESLFISNELQEITNDIYSLLQELNNDIEKYYTFVSNIRISSNFDHLWYIIESLAKMPDSISNNFIDIFMSKFNNEKTQSHVNINISLDDLKDLVNTIHLSGEHLEKLATIRFDELTDKEWNFLYCLPIIENENKEWFEDFFSMLKIYCK